MSVTKLNLNNKIINGAFDFWQRGTSFASPASNSYTCDRWRYGKNGTSATQTVSISTDVPAGSPSQYSMQIATTVAQVSLPANTFSDVWQNIEGNVLRSFKGKKMAIAFWVKSPKVGTHSVFLCNFDSTMSFVTTYEVAVANTWEKKVVRITHDSSGSWNYDTSVGMSVAFVMAVGTSYMATANLNAWANSGNIGSPNQVNILDNVANVFKLADIILIEDNEGQTRVPDFQYAGRDYFEEFQLCQRYFEKSYDLDVAPATATAVGEILGWCSTIASSWFHFGYKVPKRVIPSLSFWNRLGVVGQWYDVTGATARTVDNSVSSTNGFSCAVTPAAINRRVAGHFEADAEL